ncbi:MAG TPA: hypothetical protein VJ499_09220 [Flavisolibacter sp.]|nr:hypothetical protein [Flavisolibacter sp.]
MRKGVYIVLLLLPQWLVSWQHVIAQEPISSDSVVARNEASLNGKRASKSGNPKEDDGIALNIGMPSRAMQQSIRNNMFNKGFGLSVLVVYNPFKHASVFRLGGEIGYTYYGRFKSGGLKTSYGIAHLVPVIRLRPDISTSIIPFADVFAGGDFYISNTKQDLDALETIAGIESYDFGSTISASFVKGLATGLMIRFSKTATSRLLLRFCYARGTPIKYVDRASVDPVYGFLEGRSPVEYFAIQLGIAGIGK